jgi:hypothetical protein
MVDYDILEVELLENIQKFVRITVNGSQYRKGIFKLFKYHGEYIEFILEDNGRTRIVALPIPFSLNTLEDGNIVLSFRLAEYKALDPNIIAKILNCFQTRSAKFFDSDVIFEWQN